MQVLINQNPVACEAGVTLQELLEKLGYTPQNVAVAIDGAFVPRSKYPMLAIEAGQTLDVVAPMQGG
jgi:sulfur carrier protein